MHTLSYIIFFITYSHTLTHCIYFLTHHTSFSHTLSQSTFSHSVLYPTLSDVTVQALADLADAAQKLGLEEGGQRLDVSVRQGQAKVVMHHLASSGVAKMKNGKSGKSQPEEEEEEEEDDDDEEGDDDNDDDEDNDDEEESAQSLLFEASLELLSVTGDHAVKGVREAIKRVWHALCAHR